MKIGHPKDFWGGACFTAIGFLFLIIAKGVPGLSFLPGYTMGTAARMGPAYFPFWLGLLLFVLGIVICVQAVRNDAGEAGKLAKWYFKPVFLVLLGIVLFGILLKPIGMLASGIVLIIVASLGSPTFRLKPTIYLAIFLTVFCALVFVIGLKLPIPLCPDVESLQQFGLCRA